MPIGPHVLAPVCVVCVFDVFDVFFLAVGELQSEVTERL